MSWNIIWNTMQVFHRFWFVFEIKYFNLYTHFDNVNLIGFLFSKTSKSNIWQIKTRLMELPKAFFDYTMCNFSMLAVLSPSYLFVCLSSAFLMEDFTNSRSIDSYKICECRKIQNYPLTFTRKENGWKNSQRK